MLTSGSNDHSTKVRLYASSLPWYFWSPPPNARPGLTHGMMYVGALQEAHREVMLKLTLFSMRIPCLSAQFWTRNRPGDDMQDRYNLLADQGDPRHAAGTTARPSRLLCPPVLYAPAAPPPSLIRALLPNPLPPPACNAFDTDPRLLFKSSRGELINSLLGTSPRPQKLFSSFPFPFSRRTSRLCSTI